MFDLASAAANTAKPGYATKPPEYPGTKPADYIQRPPGMPEQPALPSAMDPASAQRRAYIMQQRQARMAGGMGADGGIRGDVQGINDPLAIINQMQPRTGLQDGEYNPQARQLQQAMGGGVKPGEQGGYGWLTPGKAPPSRGVLGATLYGGADQQQMPNEMMDQINSFRQMMGY